MNDVEITDMMKRLERIEKALGELLQTRCPKTKGRYTTAEVADVLGKAPFTVRQWCRFGRIQAEKRACGRGPTKEWMISHTELTRIRDHGLLPIVVG